MSRREVKNDKDQISFILSKGQNSIQIMAAALKTKSLPPKIGGRLSYNKLTLQTGFKAEVCDGQTRFYKWTFLPDHKRSSVAGNFTALNYPIIF